MHFQQKDEELVLVKALGRAEVKAEEKVDGFVYLWGEGWAADSVEESGCRPASVRVVEMVLVRVVKMVWVRVVEMVLVRVVEKVPYRCGN
jgi:hypothetical protein